MLRTGDCASSVGDLIVCLPHLPGSMLQCELTLGGRVPGQFSARYIMSKGMPSKPIELDRAGARSPAGNDSRYFRPLYRSDGASAHDIIGSEGVFDYSKEKSRE